MKGTKIAQSFFNRLNLEVSLSPQDRSRVLAEIERDFWRAYKPILDYAEKMLETAIAWIKDSDYVKEYKPSYNESYVKRAFDVASVKKEIIKVFNDYRSPKDIFSLPPDVLDVSKKMYEKLLRAGEELYTTMENLAGDDWAYDVSDANTQVEVDFFMGVMRWEDQSLAKIKNAISKAAKSN